MTQTTPIRSKAIARAALALLTPLWLIASACGSDSGGDDADLMNGDAGADAMSGGGAADTMYGDDDADKAFTDQRPRLVFQIELPRCDARHSQ